jgi:probable F420-dependent oxidoreductase
VAVGAMSALPVLLGLPPAAYAGGSAGTFVTTARRAEDAGFAGIVVSEHVVMGPHPERYPWGRFPGKSHDPWLEPLTMLTSVAAVTTQLRLCTGVLIVPLRPAALLAKTAATLDVLSDGRLELGVGTGWQEEEFDAHGVDYARRGDILTETIAASRALWTSSPASFSSPTVSFGDIWCEPKPRRPGGPPVLFSGTLTKRNIRRIVELGDGWIPIMGETPEGVAAGVALLREALAGAGRDPSSLRAHVALPVVKGSDKRPDFAATLGGLATLAEHGATAAVVPLAAFVRDEAGLATWFGEATRNLASLVTR